MAAPVKKFRVGAVSCAVWQNDGKEGTKFFSVTMDRRYKDKEGNWKSTNSLGVNDLPKAILVLQKAFEFALLKESQDVAVEEKSEESGSNEFKSAFEQEKMEF